MYDGMVPKDATKCVVSGEMLSLRVVKTRVYGSGRLGLMSETGRDGHTYSG